MIASLIVDDVSKWLNDTICNDERIPWLSDCMIWSRLEWWSVEICVEIPELPPWSKFPNTCLLVIVASIVKDGGKMWSGTFVWLGVKDVMTVLTHWIFSVPWPFDMFRVEPVEWDAFPKWLWILSGSKPFPWDERPLLAFFTAGITGFTWRNIKTSSTRQDLASENRILRETLQKKQTEVPWYIW